jgi:hypothetical protein
MGPSHAFSTCLNKLLTSPPLVSAYRGYVLPLFPVLKPPSIDKKIRFFLYYHTFLCCFN